MPKIGSRAQVYHGNAVQTSGGLKKKDLFKDKHGCIKSKKASARARKNKNLGKLLKQKGSGCFDYKKTVQTQLGGGKNKKKVDLEKHIFIFSKGVPTYTLPPKYKNAKLGYKCKCPLAQLLNHNVGDHVEDPDLMMMNDKDMGFAFGNKCVFSGKELDKSCECGNGKAHKIKDHKKSTKSKSKSKKGGGFGSLLAKVASKAKAAAPAFQKLAAKGTAVAQKAAVKGQALAEKAKKIDFDSAMNKFDQGMAAIDQASAAVGQVQQAVGQVQQQGQALAGQVGQLGQQVAAMPGAMTQPIMMPQQQPMMMLPQQPMVMMPPRAGSKKKKSKKSKKSKK